MTHRLYYAQTYLRAFDARVVERRRCGDRVAVVLDRTAFYPTSGGQPHDTGTLNQVSVVDVCVAEDGVILHVVDGELNDVLVHGEIDWERRFDHMQQHTGQHILSQAFVRTCGAETVGFHLGEGVSTLDLDRAELGADQLAEAEHLANELVFSACGVEARFVEDGELETLPIRKAPVVEGPVRVVRIGEFDWSLCGGTHVSNSGQVGPIKVVKTERRRRSARVYFVCGRRAVRDYARKHEIVTALAGHLTTSEAELMASVERMEAREKELQKALQKTQGQLVAYQAAGWIAQAERVGEWKVVRQTLDCDVSVLRQAARVLTESAGVIALLASRTLRTQFVFACSKDVSVDMRRAMRAACAAVGGRGGGQPGFAQGGGPDGADIAAALDRAVAELRPG